MFNDIKFTYEELANVLVPETIKNNNLEFYDLIKSFCKNIMDTKEFYEAGYSRLLDINDITSEDIIKIYLDTYAKTMNIDNDTENIILLKDIVHISKDLSEAKGTVYLYNLLANMLQFVLRDINTIYDDLVESLKNPELTEAERTLILEQIESQKAFDIDYITIEETGPYEYNILTTIVGNFVDKHIIPFCHPTGWQYKIIQVILMAFQDSAAVKDNLTIYSTLKIPVPVIGDGFEADLFTPNCPNIFEYYYGDIDLGPDSDLVSITSKIYNTDRIYTQGGRVYYKLERPTLLDDISNLVVDNIDAENKQAFYQDDNTHNSFLYRTSGTFDPIQPNLNLFMGNGLVIPGDRIIFKYNWELL